MGETDFPRWGRALRWNLAVLVVAFVSGCGGSTGHPSERFSPQSEDSGIAESEAPDSEAIGEPDETSIEPTVDFIESGDEREALTDASTTDGAQRPKLPIASGRRYCTDYRDCLGLTCEVRVGSTRGVCVVPCTANNDCERNERCIGGEAFAPACFGNCTTPGQCALGFDCIDYLDDGIYSCLPTSWVTLSRDK